MMIEELPDDIENDVLDDIEPVGDESQLYEHFRVVVDKGQEMMRVDKYLFDRRIVAVRDIERNRYIHSSW
jgi:23S rRNA pseudouridine1911/1915/1917 synthase